MLLFCCCVVLCCCVLLLPKTPKTQNLNLAWDFEGAGPSGPHSFWVCVVVVVAGLDFLDHLRRTPPLHWTPLRRTAQNFALFFPLPPPFRSFRVSLGVFSLNFGGVGALGEEKKKARNFGPPTLRGPTLRGPIFLGLGPHPSGPTFSRLGLHPSGPKRCLFFHVFSLFCLFLKKN